MKGLVAGQVVRMVKSFEKVCAKADEMDHDGEEHNGQTLNPHFIKSGTHHDYDCFLRSSESSLRVLDPAAKGNSYKVKVQRVDGRPFWGGYLDVYIDRRLLKPVK